MTHPHDPQTNPQALVEALEDLVRRAQHNVPEFYVNWHKDARQALSLARKQIAEKS